MTVHQLRQRTSHLETHCFVCSPTNEVGLRIPFEYNDETRSVSARFQFDNRHCGAPSFVHGGVSLAVLNEAMAWAVVASTENVAVTRSTGAEFVRPLRIGAQYAVCAEVTSAAEAEVRTRAVILDATQRPHVQAQAVFQVLSAATVKRLNTRVMTHR